MRKIVCIIMLFSLITLTACGVSNKQIKNIALSGIEHSLFLQSDGTLWAWGSNVYGQIGNGNQNSQMIPTYVMEGVENILACRGHSFAIKTDGSLWAWGANDSGQLGTGIKDEISGGSVVVKNTTPVKIMDDVLSISSSHGTSFAIKKDHSLWAWGSNNEGQVGNGSKDTQPSPIKIIDDVKIVKPSRLGSSIMVVRNDGSLWAWGANMFGQLGDGTKEGRPSPVKIMDNVSDVELISETVYVIKTNNEVWRWGRDIFDNGSSGIIAIDQYGNPVNKSNTSPIKIFDDVKSISVGHNCLLFIKTDDTLWGMGENKYGVIGDGTSINKSLPVKVLEDVESAYIDLRHSFAIKKDGTLWAWGSNKNTYMVGNTTITEDYWLLGIGNITERYYPVKVDFNIGSK